MSMSVTLQVFTTLNVTCVSLALCSGWMALGWDWCCVESSKPWVRAGERHVLAATGDFRQQQHYRMLGILAGVSVCLNSF